MQIVPPPVVTGLLLVVDNYGVLQPVVYYSSWIRNDVAIRTIMVCYNQ
jgi:hypothetical protein